MEWVPISFGWKPSLAKPMARVVAQKRRRREEAVQREISPVEGFINASTGVERLEPGRHSKRRTVYAQALTGHMIGSRLQCCVMESSCSSHFW